jgi:phage/plasmid-associated DNA primase
MLTGRDLLRCERKYQNAFYIELYAKHIISANDLPEMPMSNDDDALYGRLLLVPMEYVPAKLDPTILKRITTPSELSGYFVHRLLPALETIMKNKAFSYPYDADQVAEMYMKNQNATAYFVNHCIREKIGRYAVVEDVYARYLEHYKQLHNGKEDGAWKENALERKLNGLFDERNKQERRRDDDKIHTERMPVNGKIKTVWKNIYLIDDSKIGKT